MMGDYWLTSVLSFLTARTHEVLHAEKLLAIPYG